MFKRKEEETEPISNEAFCNECGGLFLKDKMQKVEDVGKYGNDFSIYFCKNDVVPYDKMVTSYVLSDFGSYKTIVKYYQFVEVTEKGKRVPAGQ